MLARVLATIAISALLAVAAGVQAAHGDSNDYPPVRRVGGMVTKLGTPDSEGQIYSFRAKQVGPGAPVRFVPQELRGWRLTFLAGANGSALFEVQGNSDYEITVTTLGRPLNGIAVNDPFMVEEIPVELGAK